MHVGYHVAMNDRIPLARTALLWPYIYGNDNFPYTTKVTITPSLSSIFQR